MYCFHPQLILRTPAQPFTLGLSDENIVAALIDQEFMEAIYLASPALHAECSKWQRGELTEVRRVDRLRNTLVRYYSRFTSRCTPFGLFAGCSVVSWGLTSHIELDPVQHTRHTRLDMYYLCALAQDLAMRESIRPRLLYRPNSSWYQLGAEVRYVEQHYTQGECVHQISSLENSDCLLQLLTTCADGQPYASLLVLLATDETEGPDATAFLDALIEAQVLVSELEPLVTGPEFLAHIEQVLTRLYVEQPAPEVQEVRVILGDVGSRLRALDTRAVNAEDQYQSIVTALRPLGVPLAIDKLFQVDIIQGVVPETATLDKALQVDLLDALDLLTNLTPAAPKPRLVEFIKQFEDRYEAREVPLLEALDTESGIAYSVYCKNSYSPLVQDLLLNETSQGVHTIRHDKVQRFMYKKLRAAERNGQYIIELDPQELQQFRRLPPLLPPSLSIVFRPVAGNQLLLDSVGGSSAVNLLSRFAHAEPRIEQIIHDITAAEQEHNPAVAFAEVCHLPTSRVGNILLRPVLRALEIPYLAQSKLPAANQIRVQDLTLRMHHGQLELRSRLTQQRIIPRLSTAHNYSVDALPVYELLCDMQTQNLQSQLGFSWQSVSSDASFSPRLTCRQVILAAASWHLSSAELAPLFAANPADVMACLLALRQQWRLPRLFTLADGDNELLVDADNPMLVHAWLSIVRSRSSIQLKEYLFDPAVSPVYDATGRTYAAQFIALLVRQVPCYAATSAIDNGDKPSRHPVTRDFPLGSEWMYYKLYCGPAVANRVLRETVGPLVEALRAAGLVDDWFFVRYADPATHLRVRFHLPQVARIGEVVQLVNHYLAPCLVKGYLWKIQTDTYQRELERYGPHTMALAERLFCYQSAALLFYLKEPASDDNEVNWLWGVRAMDELLRAFDFTSAQQLTLLRNLQQTFAQEFGVNKALKFQLDHKYRQFRPAIELALSDVTAPPAELRSLAINILQGLTANPNDVTLEQLLSSSIHMLLNRLLPADARLHELVLYDLLARHYQSVQYRRSIVPADNIESSDEVSSAP